MEVATGLGYDIGHNENNSRNAANFKGRATHGVVYRVITRLPHTQKEIFDVQQKN